MKTFTVILMSWGIMLNTLLMLSIKPPKPLRQRSDLQLYLMSQKAQQTFSLGDIWFESEFENKDVE